MGDNKCARCGQFAGRGHRCPTFDFSAAEVASDTRDGVTQVPREGRVDISDRVSRGRSVVDGGSIPSGLGVSRRVELLERMNSTGMPTPYEGNLARLRAASEEHGRSFATARTVEQARAAIPADAEFVEVTLHQRGEWSQALWPERGVRLLEEQGLKATTHMYEETMTHRTDGTWEVSESDLYKDATLTGRGVIKLRSPVMRNTPETWEMLQRLDDSFREPYAGRWWSRLVQPVKKRTFIIVETPATD